MTRARDNADRGHLVGRRNILRNPYLRIWQRGLPQHTEGSIDFGADGWRVYGVGGVFDPYRDLTKVRGMYVASSGPAYTAMTYVQRLEIVDCLPLVGEQVTLSLYGVRNDSPQERTIYLELKSADAGNDFSASTLIERLSIVAPVDSEDDFTVTFAALPEAAGNGVQLNVIFCEDQLLLSGEEIGVEKAQMEVGDKASPFEYLPYAHDYDRCQRYYQGQTDGQIYSGDVTTNGNYVCLTVFPVEMRATPNMTVTASSGSAAFPGAPHAVSSKTTSFRSQRTAGSTIHGQIYVNSWMADAEL